MEIKVFLKEFHNFREKIDYKNPRKHIMNKANNCREKPKKLKLF